MANARSILAGIGAGGPAGFSLAYFAPGGTAAPVGTAGTAGVQTITTTGIPTGGTISLTWNGNATAPIVFNATSAAVQAALNALPGGASITASGGPLPTGVVVTFGPILPQVVIVASAALTGGTTPAVVVANTTPGVQTTNPATASIPVAFKDAGWCDQKGLTLKTNVSSADVKGYGSTQVLRTIISEQKKTADVDFLETNLTSLAVYNALPLTAVTADASGYLTIATGLPQTTQYAAIWDTTDGTANHMRYYAPYAQNITPGDLNIAAGQPIDRPVAFVLYPDLAGNTLYEYYVVGSLAT